MYHYAEATTQGVGGVVAHYYSCGLSSGALTRWAGRASRATWPLGRASRDGGRASRAGRAGRPARQADRAEQYNLRARRPVGPAERAEPSIHQTIPRNYDPEGYLSEKATAIFIMVSDSKHVTSLKA